MPLDITSDVRAALLIEVRQWGARGVETGGFLLASPNGPISIVALAGRKGIVRRRGLFVASSRALTHLFSWAADRELHIAAQAHSHGGRAFLSETDRRHGFSVAGFTTIVIPFFAAPPEDVRAWGWWRYDGGWRQTEAPSVVAGAATIVRFDEDGVA
jgi:hypothetical protein